MQQTLSFLPALVVAFSVTACNPAPVDIEAETANLRARSDALVRAEAAGDIAASLAFWSEDAVAHFAGAPEVRGKEALAGMYEQFFAQLSQFSAEGVSLELASSGDLAYELGTNRIVIQGAQSDLLDIGKYLAVWKKIDGEWYVVAVSSTSDDPLLTPVDRL